MKRIFLFSSIIILIKISYISAQPEEIKNYTKRPKIAIRVTQEESFFRLDDDMLRRINDYLRTYYTYHKKLYLLSENQSNEIFAALNIRADSINLIKQKTVDFVLDCKAAIIFENQEEPDSSFIEFNMNLVALNTNKENFIAIRDRLKNFFSSKLDSALFILDEMIDSQLESKVLSFISSKKGKAILISSSAIIGAFVIYNSVMNQKERKKLPDVPGFPEH